jgi:glycosyltransferase involved in cell wall biosynthesis
MVAYAEYFTDARIKNYVGALLDRGDSVDVFALGRERGTTRSGRLEVTNLGAKRPGSGGLRYLAAQVPFMLKATWQLAKRSLRGRYDIIHVHNMPDILALVGLPFRLMGTKVILDIHDTMPETYATKMEVPLDSLPIRILIGEELLSAACANRVIATNVMHKEVLVGHGIPERKIDQILNVGDRKIFKPRNVVPNGGELWLGYHGTIAKRLGLFLIVDALGEVKADCPGVRFLCVGEGEDLPALKEYAAQRGVGDMIEWLPFVDVEQLPEVLQKVHVGVIGNQRATEERRNYMLPVKTLEYAAMEIPSIVPRLAILERYFDGSAAFFYEPDSARELADTIRAVYRDRRLIASKLDGIRAFNAAYNWDIMADRYLGMVDTLAAR